MHPSLNPHLGINVRLLQDHREQLPPPPLLARRLPLLLARLRGALPQDVLPGLRARDLLLGGPLSPCCKLRGQQDIAT